MTNSEHIEVLKKKFDEWRAKFADWRRNFDLKGCLPLGETSTDIVPFNLQTSTLLADKLVELPRDPAQEELARSMTKPVKSENEVMRHDQVLQRHRGTSAVEPPKVVEWLEMLDPETQKIYYHNKVTGKSVWKKPEGFDEAVALASQHDETRGSFWIEVQDSKGRSYYYDLLTRETRWDRPPNFEAHLPGDGADTSVSTNQQRLQVM